MSQNGRTYLIFILGLFIGLAVLAFDLYFPLGVAGAVPYVALVLVGLMAQQAKTVLILAVIASILTLVGYFYSAPAAESYVVFINRGLALFAIWSTAIISYVHLRDLARLEPLAVTDPLTGLGNRYALEREAEKQIERYQRYGQPLSLILFDIDYFKLINDNYGHPAGDQVLVTLAEMCLYQVRKIDTVARIGGEEFAILLSDTPISGALETAERLRRFIETSSFKIDEKIVTRLTISFGVAELKNESQNLYDLIKAADDALYNAKNDGRNRVAVESDITSVVNQ